MSKVMEVTCSVGRTAVKVVGENERTFELVGGADDQRVREVVDFAVVNKCETATVSGPESAAMAAALVAAGVKIEPTAVGVGDDEGHGE